MCSGKGQMIISVLMVLVNSGFRSCLNTESLVHMSKQVNFRFRMLKLPVFHLLASWFYPLWTHMPFFGCVIPFVFLSIYFGTWGLPYIQLAAITARLYLGNLCFLNHYLWGLFLICAGEAEWGLWVIFRSFHNSTAGNASGESNSCVEVDQLSELVTVRKHIQNEWL